MGGGITTKASASWIPERSRLRPETIRSWVSPLPRSTPVLVHDERRGDVRDVGEVEDREPADGHPSRQPVGLLEERGDLVRDRARPGLRGALGQDGHQDRVPLVLGGEEPGGLADEAPGGHPDDEGEEHDHEHRVLHHPGDDAHVDLGHALERPVEPAVEPVRPLVAAGPQPRRALDRLQGERVERADDRGGGDDERELAEDLPGDAGQEGGGQEDRDQRQGDAHHRAGELFHGPDGRFLGRHPLLDVVGAVLHDDDGVVHHDADGQDQGEQGHQVHGEAESGHGDEGADDGDRHGGGGNQHAAEVLQEEEDDHEHQHARDEQGAVDGGDGFPDEERGVVPDRVLHALGELLAHLGHGLVDAIGDLDGVGARQGEHHDLRRLVTGESREVAEALLAQFDPGDVTEAHELGAVPLADLIVIASNSRASESRPRALIVNWKG